MKTLEEIKQVLAHATGTDQYHLISVIPNAPVATDGVIALANAADCFWLLDAIISYCNEPKVKKSDFQVWKLSVNLEKSTGVLNGYDDDELIVTQEIPFTDFPLEEITIWVVNNIMLLPSEY